MERESDERERERKKLSIVEGECDYEEGGSSHRWRRRLSEVIGIAIVCTSHGAIRGALLLSVPPIPLSIDLIFNPNFCYGGFKCYSQPSKH
ncbi:hypothetical protein PIB30_081142 [Stylosanthes scabra]|uniref:Uncharacterized protein n=1 Tax=Stylosanthes scabra TaxID=79078 RepID=A0ABU6SSW7_9FABA|nr:hypothetical protein [Stylosanthes scabra]